MRPTESDEARRQRILGRKYMESHGLITAEKARSILKCDHKGLQRTIDQGELRVRPVHGTELFAILGSDVESFLQKLRAALSPEQVEEILGVGRSRQDQLRAQGRLDSVSLGSLYGYTAESVESERLRRLEEKQGEPGFRKAQALVARGLLALSEVKRELGIDSSEKIYGFRGRGLLDYERVDHRGGFTPESVAALKAGLADGSIPFNPMDPPPGTLAYQEVRRRLRLTRWQILGLKKTGQLIYVPSPRGYSIGGYTIESVEALETELSQQRAAIAV